MKVFAGILARFFESIDEDNEVDEKRGAALADASKECGEEDYSDYDGILVVMFAPGFNMIMQDKKGPISAEKLCKPFVKNRTLKKKPKIFLIHALQRSNEELLPQIEDLSLNDALTCYFEMPEDTYIDSSKRGGSMFVKSFCEIMKKNPKSDISDILEKVKDRVLDENEEGVTFTISNNLREPVSLANQSAPVVGWNLVESHRDAKPLRDTFEAERPSKENSTTRQTRPSTNIETGHKVRGVVSEATEHTTQLVKASEVESDVYRRSASTEIQPEFYQSRSYKKATVSEMITPKGGSIELYGCGIRFPPGAVTKPTIVQISVDNNPDHFPDSPVMITPIIECQPDRFDVAVYVKLVTWFTAKGRKAMIMSKPSRQAQWNPIGKVTLTDRNVIEYKTPHFCGQAGAVDRQVAEEGDFYLLNGVWMHVQSARILSFFAKDEKTQRDIEGDLLQSYARIMGTSCDVICSKGSTLKVKIEVNDPPGLKITNSGDTEIKMTDIRTKRNRFLLGFRPNPHPDKVRHAEPYDVLYHVSVVDSETESFKDGFSVPLEFSWPLSTQQAEIPPRQVASQRLNLSNINARDVYICGTREHIDNSSNNPSEATSSK